MVLVCGGDCRYTLALGQIIHCCSSNTVWIRIKAIDSPWHRTFESKNPAYNFEAIIPLSWFIVLVSSITNDLRNLDFQNTIFLEENSHLV